MHLPRAFRHAGRISAILLSSALLLACTHARAQSAPPSATIGEKKTAVILVNFSDDSTEPMTKVELHNLVFGQVSDFYWEASYQKTFLSGDTFGWITLPFGTGQCNWPQIVQEGNRAATAAGANLATYDQVVYLFPKSDSCVSGGGGDIGPDGQRQIFVNGAVGFTVPMIAHEMGHGLGLLHSDALDCDVTPLGDTCIQRNYTDVADTMGSDGHFNAFQKERLGWLNVVGAPSITTVSSAGRHVIQPYETATPGVKALKILKGTDPVTGQKTWYYLEYRQPIGYDSLLAGRGNITAGVMVRTGTISPSGVATSLLLDMTPNSHNWIGVDFADGALGVGRTFTDAASGMSITLVEANASGATVDVSFGGATPPPTPSSGTLTETVGTDKTSYLRGQTVYMSALVRNGGVALSGASVGFKVTTPNGSVVVLNATSGSDGYARASYKVGKSKAAMGSYSLRADASSGGNTASATSSFLVN